MSKSITTLQVEGMSCSHCENRVKKAVGELGGVHTVSVSLADNTVTVEFDPETVALPLIVETIQDQGYDVKKFVKSRHSN